MSRCGHDGVFYRVFCITLLAIAFCFTVILINVFIDIEGLLVGQGKVHPDSPIYLDYVNANKITVVENAIPEEKFVADVKSFYLDEEDNHYRSKRSLDSSNSKFKIQNPKIKNTILSKLISLLKELGSEEDKSNTTRKVQEQTEIRNETTLLPQTKEHTTQQTQAMDISKPWSRNNEEFRYIENVEFLNRVDPKSIEQPRYKNKFLGLATQNFIFNNVTNLSMTNPKTKLINTTKTQKTTEGHTTVTTQSVTAADQVTKITQHSFRKTKNPLKTTSIQPMDRLFPLIKQHEKSPRRLRWLMIAGPMTTTLASTTTLLGLMITKAGPKTTLAGPIQAGTVGPMTTRPKTTITTPITTSAGPMTKRSRLRPTTKTAVPMTTAVSPTTTSPMITISRPMTTILRYATQRVNSTATKRVN